MGVNEGNIQVMDGCRNDNIKMSTTHTHTHTQTIPTVHTYKYRSNYDVLVQIKKILPCCLFAHVSL